MALGTILVVAVAVLGSLTVLPATLALLGDRINKGRIPFLGRRRTGRDESRVWGSLIDRVMRRPVVAVVLAGGALVALSIPALGMHTKVVRLRGPAARPRGHPDLQGRPNAFPCEADPATVVVKASDVTAPAVKAGIADLQAQAKGDPQVVGPDRHEVNRVHTVTRLSVALPGDGTDAAPRTRSRTCARTCCRRRSTASTAWRPRSPAPPPKRRTSTRLMKGRDAARVRVRPRARVHPAAGRRSARSSSRSRRSC